MKGDRSKSKGKGKGKQQEADGEEEDVSALQALILKKRKNMEVDEMGDLRGRIHVARQDLDKLQTRKMKGLKKGLDEMDVDEDDEGEEDDDDEEESGGRRSKKRRRND